MQSLARDYVKIKMDRAEVESKAGGGATTMVHKSMQKYAEEKKAGSSNMHMPGSPKDRMHNLFLSHLLRPRDWSAQNDGSGYFSFRREHMIALIDECLRILMDQPMVLRVDAPIKVFGDIHGQY